MDHEQQREQLKLVYFALLEKGYNPLGQLAGYLLTEDPTYITNHNNARTRIAKLDREMVLGDIVSQFFSYSTTMTRAAVITATD